MPKSSRRKDSKGRVLKTGESERKGSYVGYQYRFTDPITQKRVTIYAKTLNELREKEKEIDSLKTMGISYTSGNTSFLAIVEQYVETKRNRRYSTVKNYQYVVRKISNSPIASLPIRELKRSQLKNWYLELQNNGISTGTISVIHNVVRGACQAAMDDLLIPYSPAMFSLSFLKNTAKSKPAMLPDQQKRFLDFLYTSKRWRKRAFIIELLLFTGMRISELCGLRFEDVDFKTQKLSINHQLQKKDDGSYYVSQPKTEAGNRIIFMSDKLCAHFQEFIHSPDYVKTDMVIDGYGGFIFATGSHKPLSRGYAGELFAEMVNDYNSNHPSDSLPLNFTLHSLRHTFITNIVNGGVSVKSAQYLAGHSNAQVTLDVYADSNVQQACDELSSLYRKSLD